MSASTPEGKVKAKVREIFKANHIAYAHVPANQFGKAGIGDYICCVNGAYLEVEVKTLKGRMSELQKARREEVKAAGGLYVVVNEDRYVALNSLLVAMNSRRSYQGQGKINIAEAFQE